MLRRRAVAASATTLLVLSLLAPISVYGAGDPPVCQTDSITLNEDGTKSGNLTCTDIDGEDLTYSRETQASDGVAVVASDGSFTYTPDPDFNGTDEFTFSASDGDLTSDPATLSITVDDVNDPPSFDAGADQAVLEDASPQSVSGWASNLSEGPPNESSQTLSFDITANSDPSMFSAGPTVTSAGTLTYTLAADANGSANVSVRIHDSGSTARGGQNVSASQAFSIDVTPVNDRPSFNPGSDQTVSENAGAQSVGGWATGVDRGAPDESSQTVSYVVTGDTNAALFSAAPAVSSAGTLTYTPAASKSGTATITLHIHDTGGSANGGIPDGVNESFDITVNGVNDPPSFTVGADQSVAEDASAQSVSDWATDISPGPPDESSQTVSFVVTGNTNSSLFSSAPSVDGDGTLTYTSAANANGSADITLHAHDSSGGNSPPQTFSITVSPVNDEPSFNPGPDQNVSENAGPQSVSGWATAINKGAPNESGQAVNFVVTNVTNPTLFSAQPIVGPTGALAYTPAASKNGSSTVTLHIHDNGGAPGDADGANETFTITVSGVNDPPSFTIGTDQVVAEDAGAQSEPNWATDISGGPSDESQAVTFVIDGNTNTGLFASGPVVNPSGTLAFTPAADANGSANITLHARDSGGAVSPPQSFTITVTAVNDEPSFTPGADESIAENSGARSVPNWASGVDRGAANESTQSISYVVTNDTNPTLFTVGPAVSPTGTLTYTPAATKNGIATITLHIHDSGGTPGDPDGASETFTITVTGVNDPPTFIKGANQTALEDGGPQSVSGWATAISPGPSDESGQTVNFIVDTGVPDLFSSGPAVSPSGTLTFTPAANANGVSTVSVSLHDNGGIANGGDDTSAVVTFTITLTAVNDPPTFTKGANQTSTEDSGGHAVAGWATNIVKGPADESAQIVDFVIDSNSNPALFSVAPAVSGAGELSYTLAVNASGSTTIGLHAHDNGGVLNSGDDTSPTQTFTINVTGVNDAPTCVAGNNATFVNAPLVGAAITTCADLDGNSLTYSRVTDASHGTAVVNSNGTFTYTPATNFLGNDSFTFKANDGTVDSNVVTMAIQVQADPIARNDVAPTDFPAIMQGSGPTAIPVLANDVDKQGGPLTIVSATQGHKGVVAITGGGTGMTYDPTGLNSGTDTFQYTIKDNTDRMNTAVVVVVITPDTIKPVIVAPTVGIVSGGTLGTTTGRVRISWGATDVGTGLKSIQLQEKIGTGPYKTVALATPKAKSIVRTFTFGKQYKYRVRATDIVGNVSAYTVSGPFVIGRTQESSTAIVYSGPWGIAASASYSMAKARWSQTAGASATYAFNGEGIAWVSSKSTTRGQAQVFIDGVLAATVDLHATKTTHRRVVFSTKWDTFGAHSIQVVVLGTPVHPRVDVDTFVVAK